MFPMRQLVRLGQTISEWPVTSQQQSRRNAMVALTACAQRRAEREEVASYFADRAARSAEPATYPADSAAGGTAVRR